LVSLLAKKYRNIAVVGDDAQSIYGFRGADFRNILNFEKEWPDATIIVLDQNYRSTQPILDAAQGVIAHNRLQKEKHLWTRTRGGEPLEVKLQEDERTEGAWVADTIQGLLESGNDPSEIVVLYRTNAQSRAIEEELLRKNIPYQIVGGVRFYQRREVKDLLGYARFILNPRDMVALKRIINTPPRGIGRVAFLTYLAWRGIPSQHSASPARHPALERFESLIQKFRQAVLEEPPSRFFKNLLGAIRYKEYLDDAALNARERWENVEELVSLAHTYDALTPPTGLEQLLEEAALASDQDEVESGKPLVHLMTIHAAKGLEFHTVFLVGLEEGILPHSQSLFDPNDLEEERRLCYVALTRAKAKVYLSCALKRTRFGSTQINPPSRFLSEIPQYLLQTKEKITTIEV
jgi:DNA helicase-2/ATP-dependent DNA helicase PcrA